MLNQTTTRQADLPLISVAVVNWGHVRTASGSWIFYADYLYEYSSQQLKTLHASLQMMTFEAAVVGKQAVCLYMCVLSTALQGCMRKSARKPIDAKEKLA